MFALLTLAVLSLLPGVHADGGYGVDCSFPIQHEELTCTELDRKQFYEEYMQGCRDSLGPKKEHACDVTEDDRIEMSLLQPQSMVVSQSTEEFVQRTNSRSVSRISASTQNYTSTGFKKIKAPKEVMDLLYGHWEANKNSKEIER